MWFIRQRQRGKLDNSNYPHKIFVCSLVIASDVETWTERAGQYLIIRQPRNKFCKSLSRTCSGIRLTNTDVCFEFWSSVSAFEVPLIYSTRHPVPNCWQCEDRRRLRAASRDVRWTTKAYLNANAILINLWVREPQRTSDVVLFGTV